jgi:hypothetical protein
MNLKEFINSMKTSEEREWANKIVEMALNLRQQRAIRKSYDRELYAKHSQEINFKGEKLMFEQEITNLEYAIEEYLAESLRLEIGNAVQLLNNYIYIEFRDRRGHEWKCRIKYPVDAPNIAAFYKMPQDKQRIFILEEIIKTTLSEW